MRRIGNDLSPYVRRVAVSLNILYWPFELDEVFVFKDPAVVRRYNPLVRIPVLVLDDGSNLFESAAILDEIDRLSGTETVSDAKPRPATASRCTDDRNRRGVRGEGSVVLLRRSRATRGEAAHTLDRAQRQAGPRWLRTFGRDRSQGRPRGLDCWDASHQPGRRDDGRRLHLRQHGAAKVGFGGTISPAIALCRALRGVTSVPKGASTFHSQLILATRCDARLA